MRRPLLQCAASTLTFVFLSALASSAVAEGPDKPAATTASTGITANGIRRDPKGVQGVSPTWEAIGKGDGAVLARDYDAAIAAYRDAISKSPQNPLGFYRVAEAQKLKGDLKEAVKTAVINKRAGGMGLISGRKAFQRPMKEGAALLNAIQDVYLTKEVTIA